ncbi:serine hydrolase domain-containing protein [Bacilliculturomica massiliensis]|uniref:serine hydrolase domain-containing protein n=1 Tax=Bacilliculturomica massiliensis TaxID=1917867 RepID=UPI0010313604|nr:serine hydrolase domain-containing protein [Bacilliculturomica massiliensis]
MNIKTLEERLDAVISPVMNENTPGMALLIAKGDQVLIRKAYGLADMEAKRLIRPDDNFVIASNSKQFTCIAILMLEQEGLLDLDEPIARFFPDFPEYRNYVTIRQMMSHRSGIKEYFEEGRWESNPRISVAETPEMLEIIKSFGDLDFEPETQYSYSNSAYVMLGNIVEQLSGMSFGQFLQKRIFEPVGMDHTCAPDDSRQKPSALIEGYTLQEDGSFQKRVYDMALVGYADGNIQSNVDDMYKWHKYLYMSDSEALLPRERLAEAFRENKLKDGSGTGYGFGFFVENAEGHYPEDHREIWHTGGTNGFISRCSRYVDDGLTVVMLTNYEGLPKNELYKKLADVIFAE